MSIYQIYIAMNSVYTFCKSGQTKTTNSVVASTSTSTSTAASNTTSYKSPNSGVNSTGGYSFRREESKTDTAKPLTFTDEDFPSLGGGKTCKQEPVAKTGGSWGDATKIDLIKQPFTEKLVIPKKQIPPLFNKVKRTKKIIYEDEDDEEEEEDYEEESDDYNRDNERVCYDESYDEDEYDEDYYGINPTPNPEEDYDN